MRRGDGTADKGTAENTPSPPRFAAHRLPLALRMLASCLNSARACSSDAFHSVSHVSTLDSCCLGYREKGGGAAARRSALRPWLAARALPCQAKRPHRGNQRGAASSTPG